MSKRLDETLRSNKESRKSSDLEKFGTLTDHDTGNQLEWGCNAQPKKGEIGGEDPHWVFQCEVWDTTEIRGRSAEAGPLEDALRSALKDYFERRSWNPH